ncbi:hypothetical protein AB0L83_21775 [Streptomyces sp. NPDC052071]|uniref:hypothetical protein n=1 Tax=Streptomyces sp. NPDC052071 TaxID=3156666 RepID=UPI0011742A16|nr:hypothetical protein FKO01_60535 [Mesorhizobium sp. B2-3-3]
MTAADLERVDVTLLELIRRVDEMAAMKRDRMAIALLTEERHQCDPVDARFAGLACGCKARLATDEDYPGFADWVAQQEAKNEQYRRAA